MLVQARWGAKSYDRIASTYDALGWLYTGGGIGRLGQRQSLHFRRGERVLYAGAGTGQEVPAALNAGAKVTLLDASGEMLQHCARRLSGNESRVRFCHQDIFAHRPEQPYDVVVANFFLNVFSTSTMPRVLGALSGMVASGGRLAIGDFAPPSSVAIERLIQAAYYLAPLALFRVLTRNPWHPLYDYKSVAQSVGLELRSQDSMRIFGVGPRWLATLWFDKP